MPRKFPTPAAIKTLRVLVTCPGLTAHQFAEIMWGTGKTGPRQIKAGFLLRYYAHRGIVFSRFEPPYDKPGKIKPRKKWYATDKGYTLNEFYERQDGNASHANGKG